MPSTLYAAYLRGLAYLPLTLRRAACPLLHVGRRQDRPHDRVVARAPTQVARHPVLDLLDRWRWNLIKERAGGSRLPHVVERRRPGHSHPHCCQLWVGKAPLVPSRGRRFAPSVATGNKRLTRLFPGGSQEQTPASGRLVVWR